MNLLSLLKHIGPHHLTGNSKIDITLLTEDSRKVIPGACYVAVKGVHIDGSQFIEAAIQEGAAAIVSENPPSKTASNAGISWVQVPACRTALSKLACTWEHNPSSHMKIAGITGTNGKTTTAYILHAIFQRVWQRAGLMGTIYYNNGKQNIVSGNTTPGPIQLQEQFSQMLENGCRGVAMEVSSHALVQKRVDDVEFDVGIFTNFTQDHLDYHRTMEEYFEAKAALFEHLASQRGRKKPVALINADDPYGRKLITRFSDRMTVKTYGSSLQADFRMVLHHISAKGCEYELIYKEKSHLVRVPLIGRFNIYNSLAALAGAICCGISPREAVAAMADCPQVPGRLEYVGSRCNIHVFVDYAHTPDALENVCKTLREICMGKLITVFGCGGDRDSTKRPLMGAVASRLSDRCIVTSDNPRSEDPETIIKQILKGMPAGTTAITDRAEAINTAIRSAYKGDTILIAGKGHETYQEIQGVKHDFNDVAYAKQYLRELDAYVASLAAENQRKKR